MLTDAAATVPSGHDMIPEAEAARLHRLIRARLPDAPAILTAAGQGTADYILAHRIPKPAQAVLKLLPTGLAARALSQAIARNAWTFAGSGAFQAASPWRFEIAGNPLIAGERSATCLCHWHAAVFQRLFRALVYPGATCSETACAAQGGLCWFEITCTG